MTPYEQMQQFLAKKGIKSSFVSHTFPDGTTTGGNTHFKYKGRAYYFQATWSREEGDGFKITQNKALQSGPRKVFALTIQDLWDKFVSSGI